MFAEYLEDIRDLEELAEKLWYNAFKPHYHDVNMEEASIDVIMND
jgi:hypothetical protein